MRITGAFFANYAAEQDGMLYVEGGCWNSIQLPIDSCYIVMLVEMGADDVGADHVVWFSAHAPSGRSLEPAIRFEFVPEKPARFLLAPLMLPVEPPGGRFVYTVHPEGRPDEAVALALEVSPSLE